MSKKYECLFCKGEGVDGFGDCERCGGDGEVTEEALQVQMYTLWIGVRDEIFQCQYGEKLIKEGVEG